VRENFKTRLFLIVPLIVIVALAGSVSAQTYRVLHHFNNSDGSAPYPGLLLSGDTLYGITIAGGGWPNYGTVFKLKTDGADFKTLHQFKGADGASPRGRLLLSGSTLYGTTENTVFAVNTNGTGFTNLHVFSDVTNGLEVYYGLVLANDTFFGTTFSGGSSRFGTVFAVNTNGTEFTNIHHFSGIDGKYPQAGLVLSSDTLYGTTGDGGSFEEGTIFSLKTDGSGFTVLYNFSSTLNNYPATNIDGTNPEGDLLLSGNILYGTTTLGGSGVAGTVFAINTDGTGFRTLHNFEYDSEGAYSGAGLHLSGNTLYGTAWRGGSSDNGTVFALDADGRGFTTIHQFSAMYPPNVATGTNTDGGYPWSSLVLLGNSLYGATIQGGLYGFGTVFSISMTPNLSVSRSETNLVLAWPTNYAGFDYAGYTLQSATSLSWPLWTTNLPAPVIVNGKYTVTNPISGTQKFFRLIQ
jgi:uncharacterized repeat protein (TIGR03803 family)